MSRSSLLALLVAVLAVGTALAEAELVVVEPPSETKTSLRPGFPGDVAVSLEGVHCKFEYTVEGGSSEEWEMTMQRQGDTLICSLGRPTSYLYFKKFQIAVEKGTIEKVETGSNGEAMEAVTLNKKGTKARNKKDWEGNMSSVVVHIRTLQDEL